MNATTTRAPRATAQVPPPPPSFDADRKQPPLLPRKLIDSIASTLDDIEENLNTSTEFMAGALGGMDCVTDRLFELVEQVKANPSDASEALGKISYLLITLGRLNRDCHDRLTEMSFANGHDQIRQLVGVIDTEGL